MEILYDEATMPEEWLENEPEEIDDPEALKPEDWDDEEDGEWEVSKIDNPKYESADGCGEWRRTMKRNHSEIRICTHEIPNPNYFELGISPTLSQLLLLVSRSRR